MRAIVVLLAGLLFTSTAYAQFALPSWTPPPWWPKNPGEQYAGADGVQKTCRVKCRDCDVNPTRAGHRIVCLDPSDHLWKSQVCCTNW